MTSTRTEHGWNVEEALNFWSELYPNIILPKEIWYELSDYYHIMRSMQELVPYVTGNQVSKINTSIGVIKALHDDAVSDLVLENVVEEFQDILTYAGVEYDSDNTDPNYLRLKILDAIKA